ncbi:IS1595 family transposase [Hyphococcus sp. DH-69]|uniref:IS1595 family transposase n=1 Tax=Hyphococcus formosus TaxID=3143534 RepID=UPI00398A536C
MTQHFLLSAASRTLKLKDIYKAGEEAAYRKFCEIRWPETDGDAICPRCGCVETYDISTRRKFKCKACSHQFSVTSGTIFASRKMEFTDLLAAICIVANAAKGVSSVQLSRDLGVQYKTAFVLAHKIREALSDETENTKLSGTVEIDGAYFGGHIRPANQEINRVDRRLARHQTGKRRVVIALRQRSGRTLTFIRKSEAEGVEIARNRVANGAEIHADEASHWDTLNAFFPVNRINHSEAYSANGICTNQVESYFSRLRRMVSGQHHHVSPQYLHQYAAHAAWLEDHRRESNGALAGRIVRNAMTAPVSRQWKGYWQRSI